MNGAITAAYGYLFNEMGSHRQRGYPDSALQERVNVLRGWVGALGDPEVTAAMDRANFAGSDLQPYSFGRVVYAEAAGNTVYVYRAFDSLSIADKYAVLAHEVSHLTVSNAAAADRLGKGDYLVRSTGLLNMEARVNQTAMRILEAGRGRMGMPEILRQAQE